jgi:PIN domain nuclease of toxin-antitoxin system
MKSVVLLLNQLSMEKAVPQSPFTFRLLLSGDPFDRMLVAQAVQEPMHFLTADKALKPYSDLIEVV